MSGIEEDDIDITVEGFGYFPDIGNSSEHTSIGGVEIYADVVFREPQRAGAVLAEDLTIIQGARNTGHHRVVLVGNDESKGVLLPNAGIGDVFVHIGSADTGAYGFYDGTTRRRCLYSGSDGILRNGIEVEVNLGFGVVEAAVSPVGVGLARGGQEG